MRRGPRVRRVITIAAGAVALAAASLAVAPASHAIGPVSSGPLNLIDVTPDLNCRVDYAGDSSSEFFGFTACATLVAVDGVLYGPNSIPAGSGATPRTSFTPLSQSPLQGSGTTASPYRVVTQVGLGSSGLIVTQTDTYVVGDQGYRTDIDVANGGGQPKQLLLYRAGDCYAQNSDFGYGYVSVDAPACSPTPSGAASTGRVIQLAPTSRGSRYMEGYYGDVWARIGSQQPFANTCVCVAPRSTTPSA
jgi:hypothetical protein